MAEISAADWFAAMVLIADDFVRLAPREAGTNTGRFFAMATRLPMEMQMVLCNRTVGIAGDLVLLKNSEHSFRWLLEGVGTKR